MTDNDAPGAWPVWTPGARLAGFIKRTIIHYYIQNIFPIVSKWELMNPGVGSFLTLGTRLADV